MRLLVLALVPMLAGAAEPAGPPPAPPAATTAAAAPEKEPGAEEHSGPFSPGTHFGLGLDVGAPGGIGLTVLVRPWWWLRANVGVAYNLGGWGIRGGITLLPGQWVVTPTLSIDAGYYFTDDWAQFTSTSGAEANLLRDLPYTFLSGQIGLEIGSPQRFIFYLRGGLSYAWVTANGADLTGVVQENLNDPAIRVALANGNVTGLVPAFSLGFLVYIF
jgi:hypothetical protein